MFSGARLTRSLSRRSSLKLALSAVCLRYMAASEPTLAMPLPELIEKIPTRSPHAMTGSQFAESILSVDHQRREQAILSQLLEGNVPSFLRKLVPVRLSSKRAGGKALAATLFVMPEYLAIGSDRDFFRIPMNLHTAAAVADRFGFVLPTKKIVDAIYDQAAGHFTPQPLPAGPEMTSTRYYRMHNTMIEEQSRRDGFPTGVLVAGHKKDVVVTNRLNMKPGQIAIYGWHRKSGDPIQPLSTVHGAGYADYSHGIRLIAGKALMDGRVERVDDILSDSLLATVLSDEGAIRVHLA